MFEHLKSMYETGKDARWLTIGIETLPHCHEEPPYDPTFILLKSFHPAIAQSLEEELTHKLSDLQQQLDSLPKPHNFLENIVYRAGFYHPSFMF